MTKNEGSLDRGIRIALGVALAIYGVVSSSWLGVLAVVPLGTALIGWCPLYSVLGIQTCSIEN